ncbi:MAG: dihydroorotase [Clostridiales bacterium]|nr:dihydroorotase [Clostridiales bacterium]
MGKVKVVSKNNQVSVKVKSTKGEQLNQNMAELLSKTEVEGFLPFYITSDGSSFSAEYGIAGYETAKEFFKNRVIDQHTFSVFMKSSVKALSGMSAYNMEYGNVLVSMDTVLVESTTGKALFMYYPADGYQNGLFFNMFLEDVLSMMRIPANTDVSFMVKLREFLKHPENMTWDILDEYADSIDIAPVNRGVIPQQVYQQVPFSPVSVQPAMYATPVYSHPPVYSDPVQPAVQEENNTYVNSNQPEKICPVCGMHSTTPDALFCIGCGSRLEAVADTEDQNIESKEENIQVKICPSCGADNNLDSLFCSECGTRLNQEADHVEAGKFDENVNLDENVGADEDEKSEASPTMFIKNGRVVDSVTGTDEIMNIIIKDNIIEEVGHDISIDETDNVTVIDATGLVVAPGLMDTHVHFRDPGFTYKEDIITGAAAAARGGFTSVVCMANTKPAVDNIETLDYIQKKGETTEIHVMQTAAVTKELKGTELVDMDALADAGAVGFTDDGIPIMDEHVLTMAMKKAAELDLPISLHEEDPEFIIKSGVNQGKVAEQLGYGGASSTAEDVMVARDCVLALHTGASVCIQHISSGNSVELVRTAKKLGADVHAEATPHHFTLTEDAVLKYGTNARMNPPLRTEDDRAKIIEGIKDGTIDMIVTDHAPHSEEEKAKPLESAPSGITGLETSLALGIKSLVEPGHISLMKLMELMSKNPAEFYRMVPGSVTKGAPADLVIFGEKETWTVRKEDFASKASNSPFIGWELPGKVHYTICSGKIVYQV